MSARTWLRQRWRAWMDACDRMEADCGGSVAPLRASGPSGLSTVPRATLTDPGAPTPPHPVGQIGWLCKMGRHKFVEIAYGYPPRRDDWLQIELCERCWRWRRTWDDLFADPRPKKWNFSEDMMVYRMSVPRSAAPWAPPQQWSPIDLGPIQR